MQSSTVFSQQFYVDKVLLLHGKIIFFIIMKENLETSPLQNLTKQYYQHIKQKNEIEALVILIKDAVMLLVEFLAKILSHWRVNTLIVILAYLLLAVTTFPELLQNDSSTLKFQNNLRYAIKGTFIYGLGWIIVAAIHEAYDNDYMRLLKADNRQGFKRLVFFNISIAIFYNIALQMPANQYANRFFAILLLYIWLSQRYVRTAIHYNVHSITKLKMQFVCNFTMNQATSLVFIIAPLSSAVAPQLPWLPGFLTLLPMLWRFTQCFIVGTHEQYLNSIKFTLNLIGFAYSIVEMPVHSHYWRIAASIYSFYWDVFRDWKWKIRFIETKKYRIDLPVLHLLLGFFYDVFGRSIWIFFPLTTQERGLVEMTRRLAWDLLRIQRQQVFYFPKPKQNNVNNLFNLP